MSPVIAFDIAVEAQKVKVGVIITLLYNGRHAKSEKVGGSVGGSVVGRDGY